MKRTHKIAAILLTLALTSSLHAQTTAPSNADIPVTIRIDASKPTGSLHPIYRFFGYDESNDTYQKYGQELLGELGKLGLDQVYIRCHHLMTSGDGSLAMKWGSTNIYTEDAKGNPVYSWTIVDKIFDTYMKQGVKPYVEIGFMPKDLSTRPDLYPTDIRPDVREPADAGQAYPPKDYNKWRDLCRAWVAHCVERYGKSEVEKWYWEVWNEPDISYWKGKPADYYKLYDYAVDGVRSALPTARVGGPEAASSVAFVRNFLEHCARARNEATGKTGSPLDFISFHAKGSPRFVDDHVQMGISNQLNRIDRNFAVIASFPEFKNLPIVIGESDPDGMAAKPISEAKGLGYRNTTLFSSYTAATLSRTYELAADHGVNIEGALTWSFEFENKPYFIGYRVLSTNGIDLPVMNLFRMYAKMSGQQLHVDSSAALPIQNMMRSGVRSAPDINAVAAISPSQLSIITTNYFDDDVPGPAAVVDMNLTGIPHPNGEATLTEYRIDSDHSNSYTVWTAMGSPQTPTAEQYAQLKSAGQLATMGDPKPIQITGGAATLHLTLPRQAVSLLVLHWKE